MTANLDAEDCEQLFCERTAGDACCCFTSRGALEDVAEIVDRSSGRRLIGVTWARSFEATGFLWGDLAGLRGHYFGPVGPIFVFDQESEWGAEGETVSDAGEYVGVVLLNLHAAAASVTKLAAVQFLIDEFLVNGQARGQALNDGDQGAPV